MIGNFLQELFLKGSYILKTEKITAFFDAEAAIAASERLRGKPMAEGIKELVRAMGEYINEAYAYGYQDGLEAAHV